MERFKEPTRCVQPEIISDGAAQAAVRASSLLLRCGPVPQQRGTRCCAPSGCSSVLNCLDDSLEYRAPLEALVG